LAQVPDEPAIEPTGLEGIAEQLSGFVPNVLAAIAILIVGIVIALLASSLTKNLLKRTEIDNKIAEWIAGGDTRTEAPPIEKWIASAVYWIIIIFTVVAVLQTLQLEVVSEPLNNFLDRIIGFLPQIFAAAILLLIAWLLATLVKLIATRAFRTFGLDERLGQQTEQPRETEEGTEAPRSRQFSLSDTLGSALYWFIFLLFLPSILSTLGLEGTLRPVQELLNEILAILPDILAAVVIAAAGWLVAQVVRRIVTNLLAASGADSLGTRFGLSRTGSGSLSAIVGTLVYVLILIPVAIAALNALQIDAISEPAIAMLNQILDALPKIFTAALILVIAYVLGRFVSDLVTNVLTSVGFNRVFQWLGLPSPSAIRTEDEIPGPPPPPEAVGGIPQQTPPDESLSPGTLPTSERPEPPRGEVGGIPRRTPSELMGIIVLVGIMLFGAVAAVNVLQIEALTAIISGLVLISGQILAGLIIFAIGLFLANLTFNLIVSAGNRQSRILGQTARIAIIAFSAALALQQIGIAPEIVNLAFGLLLGAIAVAIALAFGLGGRDIAAGQLREWLDSFKHKEGPYN
jgi:hypothetical protein